MIQTFVSREFYMDRILPFVHKPLIKVLVGQRRVGKSILMKQLSTMMIRDLHVKESEILMINKELVERSHIVSRTDLLDQVNHTHRVVMIDEIQDIIDREKAIRDLSARWTVDLYITWSNASLLSGELATYLSGRYVSIHVYPFDIVEFGHIASHPGWLIDQYMEYGGMPFLSHLWLTPAVKEYSQDVINTIILKDVIQRHRVRNISLYRQLIVFLARHVGSIISASSISSFLHGQKITVDTKTILEYLSYAKDACFIHEVPRYDIKGKKIFEIKQKRFFTDIGLRNVIAGWMHPTDLSWVFENLVVSQLITRWRTVMVGQIWEVEVDIVAQRSGKTIYLQVCLDISQPDTLYRELRSLQQIQDNRPKIVVVYRMPSIPLQSHDGIDIMSPEQLVIFRG